MTTIKNYKNNPNSLLKNHDAYSSHALEKQVVNIACKIKCIDNVRKRSKKNDFYLNRKN